ncbi:hypothetical protein ACHAXT_013204 [Thalassiosira profunda]
MHGAPEPQRRPHSPPHRRRARPDPPPSPTKRDERRHRGAFVLLGAALAFVTLGTFALVGMLPPPTAHEGGASPHSMMALQHLEQEWVPKPRGGSSGEEEARRRGSHYDAMLRRASERGEPARNRGDDSGDGDDKASADDARSREGADDAGTPKEDDADDEEMVEASGDGGDEEEARADYARDRDEEEANRRRVEEKEEEAGSDDRRNSQDEEGAATTDEEDGADNNEVADSEDGDARDARAEARSEDGHDSKEEDAAADVEEDAGSKDANSNENRDASKDEEEKRPREEEEEEGDAPRVIHVLETRFMQNQPHLVALARARLHLLRAVCLPSVRNQTAWGQFVWIIRTDPELNDEIKEELVALLEESGALAKKEEDGEEHALTYVVGSNDNYIVANSTTVSPDVRPFDMRSMLSSALARPESIFAGKPSTMQLLLDQVSAQRAGDVILWTRLDADDGLNREYMEYLQSQAIRYFLPERYKKAVAKEIPENPKAIPQFVASLKSQVTSAVASGLRDAGTSKSARRAILDDTKEEFPFLAEVNWDKELEERASSGGKEEDAAPANATEGSAREKNPVAGPRKAPADDAEDPIHRSDSEPDPESKGNLFRMVENAFEPPQWTYWCSGQNVDWFLTDPLRQPDHKNGTVYAVVHSNVCVTPGVTVAVRGSFDPLKVPRLDHDKIISYLRDDKEGKLCERKGLSVFDENGTDDDDEEEAEDDGTCFHMVRGWMSAVRSRTPTSAGMMGIQPDKNQMEIARKMPKITHQMWRILRREFTIPNEQLVATNAYFAKHVYDIAEENARGQCTAGHSCKTSSKDLLQQYVDLKSETRAGFDVVNGTIVSLQSSGSREQRPKKRRTTNRSE